MLTAKPMRPPDFQFATQLANTMNWQMAIEDFALAVALEPDGCFVAMDGDRRVGIASCISYGGVGWFGNLIVEEEWRGRGAGAFLVQHAITYFGHRGIGAIGLYSYPKLQGFYAKQGFKQDVDFAVMHAEKPMCPKESTAQRIGEDNFEDVAKFDAACFGGNREKLLKKVVFDGENLSYCISENKKIVGYAAAKVFGDMAEIGPLVCLPQRQDAAVKLLRAVVGRVAGREAYVCLPKADLALCRELSALGFVEEFKVKRMFLGAFGAKNCIYIAESLERG
jgi:GNAT superfamily N-acetyltransferase